MEEALRKRQDKGRNWWELRLLRVLGASSSSQRSSTRRFSFTRGYALDTAGQFGNNKTFFLPSADLYLLAVLNSPLVWWHNWRYLPHMKDEALSPVAFLMESLPIARPTDCIRTKTEAGRRPAYRDHAAGNRQPGGRFSIGFGWNTKSRSPR